MAKLQAEKKKRYERYAIVAAIVLASAGLYAAGRYYYAGVEEMDQSTAALEARIAALEREKMILGEALISERQKNEAFASQIGEIASTVGKLDKLSKTDEELLQKYSKVYFLNENYVPADLTVIPKEHVLQKREEKVHTKVYPYLQSMINDAKKQGLELKIISAYRSFGEQAALKNSYTVVYGSGANRFSADQGYSEHQLGTTVDLTTAELGTSFTRFKETAAYEWLAGNAHRYGFILSYPEGNTYYQYEPWHWRFVGKNLARRLYEERESFYGLDQRYIDNYLISIFD